MSFGDLRYPNNARLYMGVLQQDALPYYYGYVTSNSAPDSSSNTSALPLTNLQISGGITVSGGATLNIPLAGKYLIEIVSTFGDGGAVNATPFIRKAWVQKNNTTGILQAQSKIIGLAANAGQYIMASASGIFSLAVDDTLAIQFRQESGANSPTGSYLAGSTDASGYNSTIRVSYLGV